MPPYPERMSSPLLVFDGDDTLWVVEPLYDEARSSAGDYLRDQGLDPQRWEVLQRAIDVENVKKLGLAASRFPTSCVEAYRQVVKETGGQPDKDVEEEVWRRAARVFERKAPLVSAARDVLEELASTYRLALLTQGELWVQERRVNQSGLAHFFEVVQITERKSSAVFAGLLDELNAQPSASWSIGNSLPSDIYPALDIGMSAVWVDAHVWEYERRQVEVIEGCLLRAERLADIAEVLRRRNSRHFE
jgi:putative hydrolase of the HAD superfamily